MKKLAWLAPFAFAPMIACGDDGGGGVGEDASPSPDAAASPDASSPDAGPTTDAAPNPGFVMPTAVTAAAENVDGTWTEVGAANWDCLGTPDDVESPTEAVTVTGTVSPFSSMGTPEPVEGGDVSLYTSTDFFADAEATSDPIAADGSYSIEVPAGVERVAFRVDIDKYLPTFTLGQSFAADATAATLNLDAVQEQTADSLAAIVLGRTRTPGRGIVAGSMNDCDGNRVMHAIATVSSTSGEVDMVEDAVTSYFSKSEFPGGVGVRTETTESGLFLIPELHESQEPVYLQVWGYPTRADLDSGELVQLAEVETTVLGDAILTVGAGPLRTEPSAAN